MIAITLVNEGDIRESLSAARTRREVGAVDPLQGAAQRITPSGETTPTKNCIYADLK